MHNSFPRIAQLNLTLKLRKLSKQAPGLCSDSDFLFEYNKASFRVIFRWQRRRRGDEGENMASTIDQGVAAASPSDFPFFEFILGNCLQSFV
jgi:hypothetical protein